MLLFLLGGYWDVAWHIEVGRDTFWSPPHLLLYGGILTVLGACAAAFTTAWRRGRRLPGPGATIAAIGAALALASAPIDDLWHRLYGLDVTIWSPPHIMLIAGMVIAAYGALAGFSFQANRRTPDRLAALWRSTWAGRRSWAAGEAGLFVAGGLTLATATSVLGEYDFDVSRYAVAYHPIALSGLAAVVLTAVARAGGRVGGATLAAAAYTAVRLLVHLELVALVNVRAQIPLLLLAAPVFDFTLWKLTGRSLGTALERGRATGDSSRPPGARSKRRRGKGGEASPASPARVFRRSTLPAWSAAALAGGAFAAALLLVQWPYTTAANTVVWGQDVLAGAALPSLLAGGVGGLLGWALGAALRP
ncbi:MAG: hypothetical protein ACRDJN_15175, partial [Chloroflexota bacterium]